MADLLDRLKVALAAVEFDPGKLAASGSPIALVQGVHGARSGGFARTPYAAVSSSGTLVYMLGPSGTTENMLVWVDQTGRETQVTTHRCSHFYPRLSPDGRWIFYTSDECGRDEIYVRRYPGPGGKWPISRNGGREPVWSASGTESFYRQGSDIISVAVQTSEGIVAGGTAGHGVGRLRRRVHVRRGSDLRCDA